MMKALTAVFVLLVALSLPVRAVDPADDGDNGKIFELQLLTFNDYHGHLLPPAGGDATLGPQLDPAGNLVGGVEYLSTTRADLGGRAARRGDV